MELPFPTENLPVQPFTRRRSEKARRLNYCCCVVWEFHTLSLAPSPSGPRSVSPSLGCLVISQVIWQLSVAPSKCFHLWLDYGLPGLVPQMEKLSEQAAARASLKSSQLYGLARGGSMAAGTAQTTAGQGWPGEAAARQQVCTVAMLHPSTHHPLPSHMEHVPSWESVPQRGLAQLVLLLSFSHVYFMSNILGDDGLTGAGNTLPPLRRGRG